MSAILFGLLTSLFFALSNTLLKIPSTKLKGNDIALIRGFWTILVLTPFLFISNLNTQGILAALTVGILGYIPLFYLFKAFKHGKVGVVLPIANSFAIITTLMALIFLKEYISLIRWIAMFIIIAGIVILTINFKEFKSSLSNHKLNGTHYAVITALGWGIVTFLYTWPAKYLDPYSTSLLVETGVLLAAYIANSAQFPNILTMPKNIIPAGILAALASVCMVYGLSNFQISLFAPIIATSPILGAISSHLINKELLTRKETMGLITTVIGLILISL